jgi:HSP20 family protein
MEEIMAMRDLIPWGRQSNAPARWDMDEGNPIVSLHRNVNRLFDDMFRDAFSSFGRNATAWPSLEVAETDNEVRVTAEVPGLSEKDVELLVEDRMLTIRGERKSATEDKSRGYSERYYGRFERRIALPSNVDDKGAKAEFRDGVLTVRFPKSAEAERGRRIPINDETRH